MLVLARQLPCKQHHAQNSPKCKMLHAQSGSHRVITLSPQYRRAELAFKDKKHHRENVGKQKVLQKKNHRAFFLDSNFTSKEKKADKSLGIQQKLKCKRQVSPAEDCQGESVNSVTPIQLIKSSRGERTVRAEPTIIVSLQPEQLFCCSVLEY